MRNAAFLAIALVLILLQENMYWLLGPLDVHGWKPSLVLPLVVFLGVHEPSMARGAALAFAIGHALDLLATAPLWLFSFTYVALWWLARIAGVRLTAQTVLTQMAFAFGLSLVQSVTVLVLLVIFGADPQRPVEISTVVLPNAVATALAAPLVFRLAERLHQGTLTAPRPAEATQ